MIFRPRHPVLCTVFLIPLLVACRVEDEPIKATAAPPKGRFLTAICVDGKCAAVDQSGVLKIPFDNPFDNISPTLLTDTVLVSKNKKWYFPDPQTGKISYPFADEIRALLPGYVGYLRDGKWGVIDAAGHDVQSPRFDSVAVAGQRDFMTYQVAGHTGLLDAHAQVLTEPVFDAVDTEDRADLRGNLVMAQRGGAHWVVNLTERSQSKVDYSRLQPLSEGHMVADAPNGTHGLVDARGHLVIPLQYEWLGDPANGLLAFRPGTGQPCGYLDFTGKVVIPAHLSDCGAFGKKGAIAAARVTVEGTQATRYGLLQRDDRWLAPPPYDSGGPAGRTLLVNSQEVPGFGLIGEHSNVLATNVGLFDTDTGSVLVPPTYKAIGVLTPDRIVFSRHDSPKLPLDLLGHVSNVSAIGLMTPQGKVLADATRYIEISQDGAYLRGIDGAAIPREALLDLDGHELIDLQWNRLVVDEQLGVVFGYTVRRTDHGEMPTLRALYDLQGKPIFSVMTLPCGAEQLIDATGKPVWPLDPNPYCTKAEAPLR